ncbi:MAG: SDR family oxidoreductase [Pedobacter sp.]
MQVFVTGASGFIGSAIVKELINAGHQVLGLVRSAEGAVKVEAMGAEAYTGDVNDPLVLKHGATTCDAIIHTAFNHDFSQFKASCEADRKVIEALGGALIGTKKPLVITSGLALLADGTIVNENHPIRISSEVLPRVATEEAVATVATYGVNTYIVRLPPSVHGVGDHGFVPLLIELARSKEESAYVGEGANRWPAVHRFDAARLYRMIVEQQPAQKIFHPVGEEGIDFKKIATAIGNGLNLPTTSKTGENISGYFGWFAHFASIDCPADSTITREVLQWAPQETDLIVDMKANYF